MGQILARVPAFMRMLNRGLRATALLSTLAVAGIASPNRAEAWSGLYLQLGAGFGSFSGSSLVVTEDPNVRGDIPLLGDSCCPGVGVGAQFRLGFSVLGFGGPEFLLVGDGFDLGGEAGGAGFIGGGVRLFPLKFISLGGLDISDFPIDIGIGAGLGYAIVGKDFAYSGTFWDLDFEIDYKLASFMSAGVKLDIILPTYSDFVFTDYKNNRGRCLDSGGNHDIDGGLIDKDSASCAGEGPSTTFISPQVVFTFHFDLLDV